MATTEPAGGRRSARFRDRSSESNGEPLEQRLDRWVSAGRQLVDGVSGARPGSRAGERRPAGRGGGAGGGAGAGGVGGLGRWVEEKLDWLLEDGDDWREPWQETPPPPQSRAGRPSEAAFRGDEPAAYRGRPDAGRPDAFRSDAGRADAGERIDAGGRRVRRSLEAVSRRGRPAARQPLSGTPLERPQTAAPAEPDDWPSEDSFRLNRWQRPASGSRDDGPGPAERPRFGTSAAGEAPSRPMPRSSRRR